MYDIEIIHIKGTENTAADALSRLECRQDAPTDEWKAAYMEDPITHAKYFTKDGVLINPSAWHHGRIWKADRIVVPRTKYREILTQCHSDVLHGHWGVRKTYDALARKFIFPAMKSYVSDFVKICPACQKAKADRRGTQGLLQPLPLPTRKWQSISMDWVTGVEAVTRKGISYDAILTVTDRATRMVHLIPTTTNECAADTADLMLQNVIKLHGIPRSIMSDRDPRLTSEFWRVLCEKLDVRNHYTTAYHPQTNGLAEVRTKQ